MTTITLYPISNPEDAISITAPSAKLAIEETCELLGLNPCTFEARYVGETLARFDGGLFAADLVVRN